MTEMQESTFKPGDLVRWIGEWSFPLVDAPPRENTVLAIEADGKVRLEGRHGNEAPQRWCCPPSQLVHREPCAQQIASEDASSPAGELLPECSACGETCHWNDEADRDDSDSILCNPCAQRIASETSQYLRDFEASLVSAGKWDAQPELPLNLLAREIVAQAERWRIDAEHYRSEASNATATMVESLSAEVAQLTGEVAATRAEANRQIETLRETANRKLGEMREHNKANIMERDKARSENAALREEVQMWRDRAESDRKRDVTRGEEFKSALAEALGEQALAYQAAGERKSHPLEVMRGILRLELAMAEVLRSLARGEQKSNGKVEISEPIADHDVEKSEAPTRVFSADSSVEGLHRRLEEADIRLAGLQDESASLRLSLQEETRKVIEYSDLVDQYKMAMAQVQGASAAQISAALNPSLGATTLRKLLNGADRRRMEAAVRRLAAQLRRSNQ